uniref:Uncharacterized protein n=1 Tax=Romanomermis culicivorax TaxID=13658 RepID=A0A915JXJ1_ROMCU
MHQTYPSIGIRRCHLLEDEDTPAELNIPSTRCRMETLKTFRLDEYKEKMWMESRVIMLSIMRHGCTSYAHRRLLDEDCRVK